MHSIELDLVKNRIIIKLEGTFTYEQGKICLSEIIEATPKMKHNFDVITDVTQLGVSTPQVAEVIKMAQKHIVTSGARRGVRIVSDEKVLTGMQFKRVGKLSGFYSVNVNSMEEAELELGR